MATIPVVAAQSHANNGTLAVTGANVMFSNNTATCKTGTYSIGGGAIYAFDATMSISNGAQFTNNKAITGGRLGGGGAIWVKGSLTLAARRSPIIRMIR